MGLRAFTIVVWLAAAFLLTGRAMAEERPYLGNPKDSYKLLVIGDTLAPGIMFGLQRQAAGDLRLSVDGRYKDDSGLARPEFQDWTEALPRILDSNSVDIVVLVLGSNDAQPMREGNAALPFNSPQWQEAYGERLDRLMAVLKMRGVPGYWVGPPPAAGQGLDDDLKTVAAIQKARADAAGLRFIDLRPAFSDQAGKFAMQAPDETGAVRRLRDSDGLHFTKTGNNRAGQLVLAAIRADIAAADGAKMTAAAGPAAGIAPGAPAADGTAEPATPVFGQARLLEDGDEVTTVRPDFMPPSAPVATANADVAQTAQPARQVVQETGLTGKALMDDLARSAAQDSSAARLFTTGLPPAPKPGRLDDFASP